MGATSRPAPAGRRLADASGLDRPQGLHGGKSRHCESCFRAQGRRDLPAALSPVCLHFPTGDGLAARATQMNTPRPFCDYYAEVVPVSSRVMAQFDVGAGPPCPPKQLNRSELGGREGPPLRGSPRISPRFGWHNPSVSRCGSKLISSRLPQTIENIMKNFSSCLTYTHRPKFREDNIVSVPWARWLCGRESARRCEFYRTKPSGY